MDRGDLARESNGESVGDGERAGSSRGVPGISSRGALALSAGLCQLAACNVDWPVLSFVKSLLSLIGKGTGARGGAGNSSPLLLSLG